MVVIISHAHLKKKDLSHFERYILRFDICRLNRWRLVIVEIFKDKVEIRRFDINKVILYAFVIFFLKTYNFSFLIKGTFYSFRRPPRPPLKLR